MSLPAQNAEKISLCYFYTFLILMIITGSINTIANKLQNISLSLGEIYNHSFFITFLMFLGESICLIVYYFKDKNPEQIQIEHLEEVENILNQEKIYTLTEPEKPEATPFMLILPALCDFFGSTIMTIGLTMLSGSTYQMMRGSVILFTSLFSRIFLNNKILLHNYIGLSLVITGLFLVGVSNVLIQGFIPEGCGVKTEDKSTYMGYILVIFAQIFSAFQFIIEEKFTKHYTCDPLKVVGWEGVWGSGLYFIVLIIFQNITCPNPLNFEKNWATAICTKNNNNQYHLEDTNFAFKQIWNNKLLLFYTILFIISIAVFNYVGITITKIASAPARAVIDTVRTIFIWAFFILPIVDKCHREHFNWIQLFGFIFLIFGTLIYNKIISLFPFNDEENEIHENPEKMDVKEESKLSNSQGKKPIEI